MSVFRTRCVRAAFVAVCLSASASPLYAQSSFTVAGREVQVHGSVQQGFVVSGDNNFLTMDTRDGSSAMTDGAVNMSSQINSRLRVGAQVYSRNIGDLGDGHFQLDWVYGDYRFHDTFGVRAGKVKSQIGLYSDTQDMEFLYTWAMLPQGVYPLDLRSVTIAHVGADVYGALKSRKFGTLNYVVYGGELPDDTRGGYRYGFEDGGLTLNSPIHAHMVGGDLRWSTPIEGLTAGYSLSQAAAELDAQLAAYGNLPLHIEVPDITRQSLFGDYQWDRVRLSAEFRREAIEVEISPAIVQADPSVARAWFVAGSYRFNDLLEVGSYYTSYVANTSLPASADDNHISGPVVTGRFDINRFWNVKVEGHFMDGYGDPFNAHGFYTRNNPTGLKARTNMLVVRTGINF